MVKTNNKAKNTFCKNISMSNLYYILLSFGAPTILHKKRVRFVLDSTLKDLEHRATQCGKIPQLILGTDLSLHHQFPS